MPGIYTPAVPFGFPSSIKQGSRMATNPWLALVRVKGWDSFQTPAVALCFPQLRRFENKDIENAFVAKYEITLDECLAWTKGKSRPLCYAVNFLFLWKIKYLSAQAPEFPLFSLVLRNAINAKTSRVNTKGFLFCLTPLLLSPLFISLFFLSWISTRKVWFFSSLWPRSNHPLTAVQRQNQIKSDFPCVCAQISAGETTATLTEKSRNIRN